MSVTDLLNRAQAVLSSNDLGGWTKPAPDLYPHQWNWDSAFIAIGLSHINTRRAIQEIRSLLRGQWDNGMVPQIVFNPEAGGYFPGPDVWQCERSSMAPRNVATSGITQPPILASAALAIWRNAGDKTLARRFLEDTYPSLEGYHRFFYEERDPDGSGLIVVVHPWESGLDNLPAYLEAGRRVEMDYRPHYVRLDTHHVDASNRPSDKDYDLFVYLLERMREVEWDQKRYLKHAPLQVQDVLFNSILVQANRDLAQIAEVVGADSVVPVEWANATEEAINSHLWDEQVGMYYSYDRVRGDLLRVDTVASLGPLYSGTAPPQRLERMLRRLIDPSLFWPEGGYPIPTTAMTSTWFDPRNYWRGPVWLNTNWMIIEGLLGNGRSELATKIAEKSLGLIARSGFREYFNPLNGEGYGTDAFSWSAALTIDLLTRGFASARDDNTLE